MAKPKPSRAKKLPVRGQKKRSASSAFPEDATRDEFFEHSDSDAPSEGEEEPKTETAGEKRLRLGTHHTQLAFWALTCA